eukprot:728492-Karenia_brevis.AAC.1
MKDFNYQELDDVHSKDDSSQELANTINVKYRLKDSNSQNNVDNASLTKDFNCQEANIANQESTAFNSQDANIANSLNDFNSQN